MTMYRIRPDFPDAIYTAPDGIDNGFANTNGGDEALTRAMMADIESKYCVDRSRYFATGFSYGGSMSFTAACNMSDVFRAIGAMAGAPISGANCSRQAPERPVAVWATHGTDDTALGIDMALSMLDVIIPNNGCTTETQPVDPSPCVAYQGCDPGYPVVWCPREGEGHSIPSFAASAIADFFQQF
jgi:poly(3-hydroxybutyrate) depolymerase